MILITGAGGKTGKALIKALSQGEEVCALVHREEQMATLKSLGAYKVIVGELQDQATIHSAMQGVQRVYHICPNMHPNEVGISKLIINEAQRAGVQHFAYHSVLHPQTEKMQHHWQKLRVEEIILESGIPFTILQPAPYMQNLLNGWQSIIEEGILRVPYSVRAKFSFVDLEDVAEAAKIMLTEPGHVNAIYELAGTGPMSHIEVAEILSQTLKRNVHAEKEELNNWKLRTKGISGYALENLIRMFEYYDQWGLPGNSNVLSWVLGRKPTSLATFTERIVEQKSAI